MFKIICKKETIKYASFLLCCGLIVAILLSFDTDKALKKSKTGEVKTPYSEQYSGFEKGTVISKVIVSENGETHETMDVLQEDKAIINVGFDKTINKASNKYEVQYYIKNINEKYMDVLFFINKENNNLVTKVSGLSRHENVSLSLNGNNIFDNVPADWSGKISLKSSLSHKNKASKICIIISKENNNARSICHHIERDMA